MPDRLLTIEQVLTILAETPPRITALTTDLDPAHLHAKPNRDEWSANNILAHLRACADVWGHCIALIITQDKPTIRAINPRSWINSTNYLEQEFQPSLQAFTTQRADLLTLLEPLAHNDWSRTATITGAGKVLERTVHAYAQRLAEHERPHLKQMKRLVSTIPH